jgi:hypothetical protein
VVAAGDVGDGQGHARDGQAGQGEEGGRLSVRRDMAESAEFAAMWATQDVAHPHHRAKVFRHPLYPHLEMTSTSFAVHTAPGTRMVVYTPDNEATRAAVERLVADPVQHHFPCWPAHQARTRDLLTV